MQNADSAKGQAFILMGDFNNPGIRWWKNAAEHRLSSEVLELLAMFFYKNGGRNQKSDFLGFDAKQ